MFIELVLPSKKPILSNAIIPNHDALTILLVGLFSQNFHKLLQNLGVVNWVFYIEEPPVKTESSLYFSKLVHKFLHLVSGIEDV